MTISASLADVNVWALRVLPVILLLCLVGPGPSRAQNMDQLEMLQGMTPEQQRALLESLGQTGGRGGSRGQIDRPLQFPQTVFPREQVADDSQSADGVPRLAGSNTVLLSLEIRRFERRAPEIEERERRKQEASGQQPEVPGRSVTAVPVDAKASNDALVPLERSDDELRRLNELRERMLRRNPYKLDKWGILNISELGPVPLAGLTAEEATQRLSSELRLQDFIVVLTRLPLLEHGPESLKPFGYDLFEGVPSTFAPATDVPVPAEYIVGPGDMLEVMLTGGTKGRYTLTVGRDGQVNFPELGPVPVSGRRFDEVREDLQARVREQMIGTQVSIGIGELRSIRVFVLGDAKTPGSYTVSGLSTITNALFVSGGIKEIGSLRDIQLKRDGRTVTRLDLYDLLLRGDTRADVRLQPGDVIFVPPIGNTSGVSGEVRRPALYELKNEKSVAELIDMAGGLTDEADPALATLTRVNERRQRTTVSVDVGSQSGRAVQLSRGDMLRIPPIRPILEESVAVIGHVHRPGEHQFRRGMRLVDMLPSLDELKPNADQRYVIVRRELLPERRVRVFSADLEQALREPQSAANFELEARDRIYVFDLESGRERILEPLMRELRLQSNIDAPTQEVSIAGRVKVPGTYPLEPGMRLADLLRAGGSLDEAAYGGQAELTRYVVREGEKREAQLVEVDLRQVLLGNPQENLALQPFDYLVIKETPLWHTQEEVEILGEVKFPGRYPIHRGETLRSLMVRAGGMTDLAFSSGAVFTRQELRQREKKQLESLAVRMESDLAQLSLMAIQEAGRDAGQALAVGQQLLASIRESEPVGRLVIDLDRSSAARPGSEYDLVLKDGDSLIVPRITQEVTVIGEVQSATSHLFRKGLTNDDYVSMSGGLTSRADAKRIYIVRADGSVVTNQGGSWFSSRLDIHPGDTIVVPLDTERMRPLPFWTAVTTLIYNLAISVAAVNSF